MTAPASNRTATALSIDRFIRAGFRRKKAKRKGETSRGTNGNKRGKPRPRTANGEAPSTSNRTADVSTPHQRTRREKSKREHSHQPADTPRVRSNPPLYPDDA